MPISGTFIEGGDWRKVVVSIPIGNGMNFRIGDFVGVVIAFFIIALVIFVIAELAERRACSPYLIFNTFNCLDIDSSYH